MKARSSIVVLAILSLACAASVTAQTNITIQNPSFENFGTLTGGTWNQGPIQNWASTSPAGANWYGSWQPGTTYSSYCDGSTVAFVNGATLTQDLGFVPAAGSSYTLDVCVGNRPNFSSSYSVGLTMGGTSICNQAGNSSAWAAGTFQHVTVTCTIPSTATGNLTISLGGGVNNNTAQQIDFDKVTLTQNGHFAKLSWQASSTPGVSYNLYRTDGAVWNPILLANVTSTSYVDTTIVWGNNYVYKVTAFLSGVESDFPSPVTVVTQ